jgi:hypothetical protein
MKNILPYKIISDRLETGIISMRNLYPGQEAEARRLIRLAVADIAGRNISDTSANAIVEKIKDIILKFDFHIALYDFACLASGEMFDKAVKKLIFDQSEAREERAVREKREAEAYDERRWREMVETVRLIG